MSDITIVTHEAAPAGVADDLALATAIEAAGGAVRFSVWSDPAVDWARGPVTVVRSTWDYHLRPREWAAWLDRVGEATTLVNPAPLIRWNSVKTYLVELAAKGISVIPTALFEAGDDLAALCSARGWDDVVVKPTMGASSHGAKRFSGNAISSEGQAHATGLAAEGKVLVQPYQQAIETERERSLVYIDGTFSHAFSKPGFHAGGAPGALVAHTPTGAEYDLATQVISALPVPPTFARIDMLPGSDGPLLMEAELIEPQLAFQFNEEAPTRLAKALLSMIPAQ